MKTVDGKNTPIVFAEWSAVNGTMIKRRDYSLSNLLDYQPMPEGTLFADPESVVPKPVTEFALTHFLKLGEDNA